MKRTTLLAILVAFMSLKTMAASTPEDLILQCDVPKAKLGYSINLKTTVTGESSESEEDEDGEDDQATLITQEVDGESIQIGKGKSISTTGNLENLDLEIRTVAHLEKMDNAGCYARGTEYIFKLTAGIGGKGNGAIYLGEVRDRPVVRALKSKKEMMKCPIGPGGGMPMPGKPQKMSCKVVKL